MLFTQAVKMPHRHLMGKFYSVCFFEGQIQHKYICFVFLHLYFFIFLIFIIEIPISLASWETSGGEAAEQWPTPFFYLPSLPLSLPWSVNHTHIFQ